MHPHLHRATIYNYLPLRTYIPPQLILQSQRAKVLLEWNSIDNCILAHHQGVHELYNLESKPHLLLFNIIPLRALAQLHHGSIRPNKEPVISSGEAIIVGSWIDSNSDAKVEVIKHTTITTFFGHDWLVAGYNLLKLEVEF